MWDGLSQAAVVTSRERVRLDDAVTIDCSAPTDELFVEGLNAMVDEMAVLMSRRGPDPCDDARVPWTGL